METEEQKRQRVQEAILQRLASAQDDTSGIDQAAADDKRKKIVMAIGQGLAGLATADSASRGGYKSDSGFYDRLAANVDSKSAAEKAKRDKVQAIIQEQALRSKFGDEDFDRLKFATSSKQSKDELAEDKRQFDEQLKFNKSKFTAESKPQEAKPAPMDPGEVALKRELAKRKAEWDVGGEATFDKNIKMLEDARSSLSKQSGSQPSMADRIKGALSQKFPTAAAVVAPERVEIQRKIETAVQSSLRPILGAQFAQKEGERILRNAYDPALGSYNIDRLNAAINEIKAIKDAKVKEFQRFSESSLGKGGSHPVTEIDEEIKQLEAELGIGK